MTAHSQSTKRKLSLLNLAQELGNVSKACKLMGYHRDTFYEIRRAFQVGGVAASSRRGSEGQETPTPTAWRRRSSGSSTTFPGTGDSTPVPSTGRHSNS